MDVFLKEGKKSYLLALGRAACNRTLTTVATNWKEKSVWMFYGRMLRFGCHLLTVSAQLPPRRLERMGMPAGLLSSVLQQAAFWSLEQ